MNESSKAMAIFFYEQCAGSYSGHMSNVPNNPTLNGLVTACIGKHNVSRAEFADLLRDFADSLDSDTKEN